MMRKLLLLATLSLSLGTWALAQQSGNGSDTGNAGNAQVPNSTQSGSQTTDQTGNQSVTQPGSMGTSTGSQNGVTTPQGGANSNSIENGNGSKPYPDIPGSDSNGSVTPAPSTAPAPSTSSPNPSTTSAPSTTTPE